MTMTGFEPVQTDPQSAMLPLHHTVWIIELFLSILFLITIRIKLIFQDLGTCVLSINYATYFTSPRPGLHRLFTGYNRGYYYIYYKKCLRLESNQYNPFFRGVFSQLNHRGFFLFSGMGIRTPIYFLRESNTYPYTISEIFTFLPRW